MAAKWLAKLLGASTGELVDKVTGFAQAHTGKREFKLALEGLLSKRDERLHERIIARMNAATAVIVAELKHGGKFVSSARPAIVYTGLVAMILQGFEPIPFTLPVEFWYAWSGVVGTYAFRRTSEKIDAARRTKESGSLLD